jgi:hypothetical protein
LPPLQCCKTSLFAKKIKFVANSQQKQKYVPIFFSDWVTIFFENLFSKQKKSAFSSSDKPWDQSDQIGRIFAQWAIVSFG